MNKNFDTLVAAAIHDAKNALLALDTQLAGAAERPVGVDFLHARSSIVRIARQLTELLTLYRADNGQLRLAIDDHDLADFLDDLVAELGPLPVGITLEVARADAWRIGAWAFDAWLLKLALLDALRNAARHARSHIRLDLTQPAGGGLCFSVSDDGPGYPQAMLDGADNISAGSTGLGLAFVRQIAAHHATPGGRHGRVELHNIPGATLRIYLP